MRRIVVPHFSGHHARGFLQVFDGDQFGCSAVSREQELLRVLRQIDCVVVLVFEAIGLGQGFEGLSVCGLLQQRPRRNVVDTRNHGIAKTARQLFRFVFGAGNAAHTRRGANE